jgi:hypothetical protein
MNTPPYSVGFRRKIGYSFVGLLAGNLALLMYLLLTTRAWELKSMGILEMFPFYVGFSILGWLVVGIPAVLLLRLKLVTRLHWLLVVVIGAALGALAQFLIFLVLGLRQNLNLTGHWNEVWWYFALAGLVSTVSFGVYCALVRRAIQHNGMVAQPPTAF